MRILISALLLMMVGTAMAADSVYRWVDSKGVVHYTGTPPTQNAKPVKLPPLQSYQGGPQGDPFSVPVTLDKSAIAKGIKPPTILEPADQATIRHPQSTLTVKVKADLKPGQGLIYTLDGKPENDKPTTSTQYEMTGVYRGTHSVGVTLVGQDGKSLITAKPVTVYMKQPIVMRNRPNAVHGK